MSRGLGRLQRFIKEQVYRAEREYRREQVALNGRAKLDTKLDAFDDAVKNFVVHWWDVRRWVEENPDFNPGPYRLSESLERSTKRALHSLVKRGEIAQMKANGYLAKYMTNEMDQSLTESTKKFMEGFARMAEQEPAEQ
jgi:hypothetical protein